MTSPWTLAYNYHARHIPASAGSALRALEAYFVRLLWLVFHNVILVCFCYSCKTGYFVLHYIVECSDVWWRVSLTMEGQQKVLLLFVFFLLGNFRVFCVAEFICQNEQPYCRWVHKELADWETVYRQCTRSGGSLLSREHNAVKFKN